MQDNSAHVSAPNADTRAWDEWLDIPPTVCVVHLRFVPCRRDEPESRCHISTDPKQVTIVRDYQTGKLSESFTHAALDRLQQSDGTVTREEIQRVRKHECSMRGHSFDVITTTGSLDPKQIICSNCGDSWQVQPPHGDFDPASARTWNDRERAVYETGYQEGQRSAHNDGNEDPPPVPVVADPKLITHLITSGSKVPPPYPPPEHIDGSHVTACGPQCRSQHTDDHSLCYDRQTGKIEDNQREE